ncbi:hypothetical protein S245_008169, partial [Arachis hypogaea]
KFLATQQYWPYRKERIFRFRLFSNQVCWFRNFFISLWNHNNQPIQVHLDPDSYVPELMDPETLDNVSRVFHIKYTRIDEDSSPDVMVYLFSSDGDENNDQDGTLIGDNPHNPIDLSGGSTLSMEVNEQSNETNELYTPEVYYQKTITASDLGQSRL